MGLHQRSQDRLEAEFPAHEGGRDAAQSRPSGARQTRLESRPIGLFFAECFMYALIALGLVFVVFGILNFIDFGRID
ncbi:MAG: hypothetical protein DHS20C06_19060 [Hyphobacterium sp.]|nr:MAG: hypothetical protein DHS20C06_19060 [Hyphobacterium sp.]